MTALRKYLLSSSNKLKIDKSMRIWTEAIKVNGGSSKYTIVLLHRLLLLHTPQWSVSIRKFFAFNRTCVCVNQD